MTAPLFYNPRQAATLLGVSNSNMMRRIESGEVKTVKAGGTRHLIHIDEIKRIEATWLNGTSEPRGESSQPSPRDLDDAAESASVRALKASRLA